MLRTRRRHAAHAAPPSIDPAAWVTPRAWTDPAATRVGNLGSQRRALVDGAGLVSPGPGSWSLDWWIGAEDRWRFPSQEPGVRQHRLDDSPVVETAVRIPGGDAVQRVYAVPDGDLLVVEVENRSATPFALALAVRPFDLEGPVAVGDIHLKGTTLLVSGQPALLLPARPGRTARSTHEGGDVSAVVTGGAAVEGGIPAGPPCPQRMAHVALLFPVAHRATFRVAIPLDPAAAPRALPATIPTSAAVAKGWAAQSRRGLRIEAPAGRLADAVEANRRHLLLLAGDADLHAGPDADNGWFASARTRTQALDQFGFHREARAVLDHLAGWQSMDGRFGRKDGAVEATAFALDALAEHVRLTGDDTAAKAWAAMVAKGGQWLAQRKRADLPGTDLGLTAAADVLAAAGEKDGAVRLRRWAEDTRAAGGPAPADPEALLATASPTFTWASVKDRHDPVAAAEFCLAARRLLLHETPRGLVLCERVPEAWWGQPLEVHDAPTRFGAVSYAVRWHGERPALLWEVKPHGGNRVPLRLQAPGLDPEWSATAAAGEALLSGRTGER